MPENPNERLDETLRALHLVLEKLATPSKPPEVDRRSHFYKMFNREADEYDGDFHKKYHDDLSTTLIFAGLFSAVASAFIVDIQRELRPDYTAMSFTVLTMLLNATVNPNIGNFDPPVVSGPKESTVQVQSILFASLSTSLLAAFLATLGKQWLNLHVEGSFIDRSRHRELRMRGMVAWHFKIIMECLPLVMQISLFLLGYALAQYLWDLSRTVSAVIAAFTIFGLLFFSFIVLAGTVWKTCPFQTPISILLRHGLSLTRSRLLPKFLGQLSAMVRPSGRGGYKLAAALANPADLELAPVPQAQHDALIQTATAANRGEETTHVSDTSCIATIFRFASGSDAIVATTAFILDVDWTLAVRRVPLLEVCDSLSRSFEFLKDGRVLVRPGMMEQANGCAKALLYLRIQRLCASDMEAAHVIATSLTSLLGYHSKEDHELETTLQVLDAVFNCDKEIPWERFVFSDAHYCFLSHILRCRAWVALSTQHPVTKDVLGFVRYSLSKELLPPPRVVADCLLIIEMILGRLPKLNDGMLIKDKSTEIDDTLQRIFQTCQRALVPSASAVERQHAVDALELMVPLRNWTVCSESYKLFRTTMVSVENDALLWYPAELLLRGAFKWDERLALVRDPSALLRFLEYSLLQQSNQNNDRDESISNIFCALAAFSGEELKRGLANVDFTQPLYIGGLCHALRENAPYRLRRATVALLRHLEIQICAQDKTYLAKQAEEFASGWSSSARESWDKKQNPVLREAIISTLMGLLDSPFWREYIPNERWDFLELIRGEDERTLPPPFYRCIRNKAVLPHLKRVLNQSALVTWIAILWTKYPDVPGPVRKQLEIETREMARTSGGKGTVRHYASILDREMERVERQIKAFNPWSFNDAVGVLNSQLEELKEARKELGKILMAMP